MRFVATPLAGVWVIEAEPHRDDRGYFLRTWCRDEFAQQGLNADFVQTSVSFNQHRGTLRGLHYQAEPHAECKLIRVPRGAIYDVVLDLRPNSPTAMQWFAVELNQTNQRQLFIPAGCAHGFQTLCDETEVEYQITQRFEPTAARGVRWNDPALDITWPLPISVIHPRDASYPDLPHRQTR